MKGMIRLELFKLRRSKYPYLLLGIFLLILLLEGIFVTLFPLDISQGNLLRGAVPCLLTGGYLLCYVIFTVLFVRSDVRGGFWRNIAALPHAHRNLWLAKSLIIALYGLVLILAGCVVLAGFYGFGGTFPVPFHAHTVPELLLLWLMSFLMMEGWKGLTYLCCRHDVSLIAALAMGTGLLRMAAYGTDYFLDRLQITGRGIFSALLPENYLQLIPEFFQAPTRAYHYARFTESTNFYFALPQGLLLTAAFAAVLSTIGYIRFCRREI